MMNMSKGTIGRNIFGEVCTEKFLKLNKETAIQQYTEMVKDIVSHGGEIEYTVDSSCFTPAEAEEFFKIAECINIMYASMAGCSSYAKYALK